MLLIFDRIREKAGVATSPRPYKDAMRPVDPELAKKITEAAKAGRVEVADCKRMARLLPYAMHFFDVILALNYLDDHVLVTDESRLYDFTSGWNHADREKEETAIIAKIRDAYGIVADRHSYICELLEAIERKGQKQCKA